MNGFNATNVYSPITMSREWSTLGRLVIAIVASIAGATVNAYFVTAFFVEQELSRTHNVYHACVAVADMAITAGVLPIATAALLSGFEWDTVPVCHFMQALTAASTYCYSLFFTLLAGETYSRVHHADFICVPKSVHNRIRSVVGIVVLISIVLSAFGTYWELDYDYCQRLHRGNLTFRLVTGLLVHGTSCVLTLYGLVSSSMQIREHNRIRARYQRGMQFQYDIPMIKLNLGAYIIYVLAWMPYLIVVFYYPDAPEHQYYQSALIGVCRALLTSLYYGSLHSAFRRAYINIFLYCCCKSTIAHENQRRNNNNANTARPIVSHIMQHAVRASPQRPSTSAQEVTEL